MATDKLHRANIESTFDNIISKKMSGDIDVINSIRDYVISKVKSIDPDNPKWTDFKSFWPPRLLTAFKNDYFLCFFGAGLSIPSGLPSWSSLLTGYLKLDEKFTKDKDLEYDPLTLAEIASNFIGSESLQNILRNEYRGNILPVTNHFMAALLRAPVYITTNYDELFEKAWSVVNPGKSLEVITNNSDLTNNFSETHQLNPDPDISYLFKIHGCVNRDSEQLILTRKDYRLHYRSNEDFFNKIRELLKLYHVLFIGFSHKDIEVTRLVEDAIYIYEKETLSKNNPCQPNFYSLQFDMLSHTPEIYAAKGIVALEPPITTISGDYRSIGLNTALVDLLLADSYNLDKKVSLETELEVIKKSLENEFDIALEILISYKNKAIDSLKSKSNFDWLAELIKKLAHLANEGVYICDDQGRVLEYEVLRYSKPSRRINELLSKRPYFRQANTFKKPFISDSFKSIFNGNSTFTLCLPIMDKNNFKGILFSACQIGDWDPPLLEAKKIWSKNHSLLLIDSNGNCLLPPNNEFGVTSSGGYNFEQLLVLSKKDKIISRVIENVVPINKDDDVINISNSIKFYSLITELRNTRWKVGIATPIILDN
jgi:hypothetical protein